MGARARRERCMRVAKDATDTDLQAHTNTACMGMHKNKKAGGGVHAQCMERCSAVAARSGGFKAQEKHAVPTSMTISESNALIHVRFIMESQGVGVARQRSLHDGGQTLHRSSYKTLFNPMTEHTRSKTDTQCNTRTGPGGKHCAHKTSPMVALHARQGRGPVGAVQLPTSFFTIKSAFHPHT